MDNLIGKKFNKLTVICDDGTRTTSKQVVWKCLCECGNVTHVTSTRLKSGHTKSCGCLNHQIVDLVGQTFVRLRVTSFNNRKNRATYWNCICDCGNKHMTSTSALKSGASRSCGCLSLEQTKLNVKNRTDFIDGTSISAISLNRKTNKNNKSGTRGVTWDKSKDLWVAQITFKRKYHYLGRYDKIEDAIAARKKGEEKYFANIKK